jgi:hypothetical protein
MLRVGFEPPTPVFELAKTVHALDRKATVIGNNNNNNNLILIHLRANVTPQRPITK